VKLKIFLTCFFISLLFPGYVKAVTITIDDYPQTISSEPFNVTVSVSGAQDGFNYLRADLYKDGTQNYFGETDNLTEWYSGSSGTSYYKIEIINATASATFRARLNDPLPSNYVGSGEYKMRIRRYTSSGAQASSDTQNPVTVNITVSTPSPAPQQTSTPEPTATPTITPQPTPTATATPKPTPTVKSSPLPSLIAKEEESIMDEEEKNMEVLGANVTSPLPETVTEDGGKKKEIPFVAAIFLVGGVVAFILAGISFARIQKGDSAKTENTT